MNAKSLLSIVLAVAVLGGAGVAFWLSSGDDTPQDDGKISDNRPTTPRDARADDDGAKVGDTGGNLVTDVGGTKPTPVKKDEGANADRGTGSAAIDTSKPDVVEKSPEVVVAEAIDRAQGQIRAGNLAAARATLATLEAQKPLSQFERVRTELSALGNFPFKVMLLAELDRGADDGMVFEVFRASSDRYGKSSRATDWREGEAEWLTGLAGRAVDGAAASAEGIATFTSLMGETGLASAVDAVLRRMSSMEMEALERWIPALRSIAIGKSERSARVLAATLMLRAGKDTATRLALLSESGLADLRRALLGVVLREKLVPASEVVNIARDAVVSSAQDATAAVENRELIAAISESDAAAGLALARELRSAAGLPSAMRVGLLTQIAKAGTDQEREELADQAKATGLEAKFAFEAIVAAGISVEVVRIYEAAMYPVVKVLALEQLAKGEDRQKWLEDGLQTSKLRPVRVGATALLDGKVEKERARLVELAEADRDPEVRKRALQTLGALKDVGLMTFFETRGQVDEDPTVQSLARGFAKELRGE